MPTKPTSTTETPEATEETSPVAPAARASSIERYEGQRRGRAQGLHSIPYGFVRILDKLDELARSIGELIGLLKERDTKK